MWLTGDAKLTVVVSVWVCSCLFLCFRLVMDWCTPGFYPVLAGNGFQPGWTSSKENGLMEGKRNLIASDSYLCRVLVYPAEGVHYVEVAKWTGLLCWLLIYMWKKKAVKSLQLLQLILKPQTTLKLPNRHWT